MKTTWRRFGVTLSAMAGLLALGAVPTLAADDGAAPEPPRVAAVAQAPVLPVADVRPVAAVPVVGGATRLTEQAKADVDGAMRCARITFTTIYYVLGFEVYRTSEQRWVCDPGVN